jgi:glycosyltransferase involved in cell wall biosynthesis
MIVRRLTADLRMYRHSGIGRYLRNLIPLLLPKIEADRVRVIARRETVGEEDWLNDSRVEFVEEAATIYSVAEQTMALRGLYRDTDLLWIPHYNAPLVYGGRMVVTIHDVAPLAMPEILDSVLKRAYAKLLIERSVKQSTSILCVSRFTAEELTQRLRVPAEKMTVTHLGLDANWPHTMTRHVEADGLPYLLYVGNVKPNKNLALLLRAFAKVMGLIPHRLVLAGRIRGFGTNDDAVVRQAEAMGKRVRFAGEVSDTELIQLYAGASASVLPSLYEGFGLPLLEAMRLGCPVLCSTAGALPEVAAGAAMYFDPRSETQLAERLLEVMSTERMDALRYAGFEREKCFRLEECAEHTAVVMNLLLEGER